LGVALASSASLLVEAAGAAKGFDAVQYEGRFSDISNDLPKDSVIGYLTDADPNLASTSAEYYLAEYALAPVVVANNVDQKLVMANVHTPQPPEFYRSRGLELVRDYGNGVLLLRKAAR
jgi:hypothetical protein